MSNNTKNIACLGWGSLVWDPRSLPIRSKWFDDGPMVKVEFVRQSKYDRLTLVLYESGTFVRSLWTLMNCNDLAKAKKALQKREDTSLTRIGAWVVGGGSPPCITNLPAWAEANGIDAVIWTALPARFRSKDNVAPTSKQAIDHLRELQGAERDLAEQYIRRTPKQVDTVYRREFEATLGWKFKDGDRYI